MSEVWKDRDLFLAFREYLYQQIAHENLSFYLEAGKFPHFDLSHPVAHYETIPKEDRPKRAKEIFNKFISPSAPVMVNLEGAQINVC